MRLKILIPLFFTPLILNPIDVVVGQGLEESIIIPLFTPERPGPGYRAFITGKRNIIVESGLRFSDIESVDHYSIGQFLIRYGIIKNLELRLNLGS